MAQPYDRKDDTGLATLFVPVEESQKKKSLQQLAAMEAIGILCRYLL